MREASEVMALASQVPNMIAFFSLVGVAIQNGRSVTALEMLTACGLSDQRAWYTIDGWDRTVEMESQTGWTPECTAMGCVIEDVVGWRSVLWLPLLGKFRKKEVPPVVDPG